MARIRATQQNSRDTLADSAASLTSFNAVSAAKFASLQPRFKAHERVLRAAKADLDDVFVRIHRIKGILRRAVQLPPAAAGSGAGS
jgi:hypothetical protein